MQPIERARYVGQPVSPIQPSTSSPDNATGKAIEADRFGSFLSSSLAPLASEGKEEEREEKSEAADFRQVHVHDTPVDAANTILAACTQRVLGHNKAERLANAVLRPVGNALQEQVIMWGRRANPFAGVSTLRSYRDAEPSSVVSRDKRLQVETLTAEAASDLERVVLPLETALRESAAALWTTRGVVRGREHSSSARPGGLTNQATVARFAMDSNKMKDRIRSGPSKQLSNGVGQTVLPAPWEPPSPITSGTLDRAATDGRDKIESNLIEIERGRGMLVNV